MAENTQPRCRGNCMTCNPFQRQFCASQLAYNNMLQLEALSGQVNKLAEKIEAIQNSEATLIDPLAQEGDGA